MPEDAAECGLLAVMKYSQYEPVYEPLEVADEDF